MPIIKSAKKRVRVARKATVRNAKTKRNLKTALKAFQAAVTGGGKGADDNHRQAQSAIDKAVKKGVISKNKAARKKRQLSTKAKAGGVTTATKKSAAKATAKKSAAKKATPKKTAKTTAKKPAAKK